MAPGVAGWEKPHGARRYHYFVTAGKSLCERWESRYDYHWPRGPLWKGYLCKVCERKRERLRLGRRL